MIYKIDYTQEARDHILDIYNYIREVASGAIAERYVSSIAGYCESLNLLPERATKRDDLQPGIRITHYKKRCVIAFKVFDDVVVILGVFYGGQDYEARLAGEHDD
jgi:toxin ParE1/3/4